VRALIERVFGERADTIDLPALARTALRPPVAQLMELRLQIKTIEKELLAWHRTSQESRRLETIPIALTVEVGFPDIWQFMRDNGLSNRVFKSYDDILDHCCFA
jgi:transposase